MYENWAICRQKTSRSFYQPWEVRRQLRDAYLTGVGVESYFAVVVAEPDLLCAATNGSPIMNYSN